MINGIPMDDLDAVLEAANIAELDERAVCQIRTIIVSARAERLLRAQSPALLARIEGRASDALGDSGKAWRWLRTHSRMFKRPPIVELLEDEAGAANVERVLGRIEHGVLSSDGTAAPAALTRCRSVRVCLRSRGEEFITQCYE